MAQNAPGPLNYYLVVGKEHLNDLATIRQWDNLSVAFDDQSIWIKDFNRKQIEAVEVKSIPYKTAFYYSQGKLFLHNSLLPDRNLPALLWTPIARALPVVLPSFNHNYFGVRERISLRLRASNAEEEATAMIAGIAALRQYIETAPAVRLNALTWAILNSEKVLLLGKPLLPIKGDVFWNRHDFIIPAGLDFDLFLLGDSLNNGINSRRDFWVIWNADNTCFFVKKTDLSPLSLSSFRLSFQQPSATQI